MLRKLRELRTDLRKAGFVIARKSGSHETWLHPDAPGARTAPIQSLIRSVRYGMR
ncbi:MAG: type II toxin-antitoxin system HicA family toxin [Chloroflexia bacterium]